MRGVALRRHSGGMTMPMFDAWVAFCTEKIRGTECIRSVAVWVGLTAFGYGCSSESAPIGTGVVDEGGASARRDAASDHLDDSSGSETDGGQDRNARSDDGAVEDVATDASAQLDGPVAADGSPDARSDDASVSDTGPAEGGANVPGVWYELGGS